MEKIAKNKKIRVRFAPSPTGFLHIGGARTALFNYLFAKSQKGDFILRIDDTDRKRLIKNSVKDIMESLKWLSIKWDEGPKMGGPFAPYYQSKRLTLYKQYVEKLIKAKKAYYCFCSPARLDILKKTQIAQGKIDLRYDGRCRKLTPGEITYLKKSQKTFVIRFKIPRVKKIIVHDLIRGTIEFENNLDDFIILKSDGYPTFHLSSVIDDHFMNINYVIRGEEWISSTPKHVLLYNAFGWNVPNFIHLPIILSPQGGKLSKRDGATSVKDFKEQGYLPEALVNFMAFLGWNPGTEREIFALPSLAKEFSLQNVQKSGAVFNIKRLDYLNGFYIRQKSVKKLAELCQPYLPASPVGGPKADQSYLEKIVAIYQERLKKLSEIKELTDFFFKDKLEYNKELLRWKDMTDEEILVSLNKLEEILCDIKSGEWKKENLEKILISGAEAVGDKGRLLWPLRVALTGKEASAGPFEIAEILGKEKTLARIQQARALVSV